MQAEFFFRNTPACVCVCVFTLVVFVQQSALTVEPGRPFVNHTLLGIRVFNRGVIVGDKVRLRWGREREREETVNKSGCSVSLYTDLCSLTKNTLFLFYNNRK